MKIHVHGNIHIKELSNSTTPLFGEVAQEWAKIIMTEIKASTMKDYRESMNVLILPRFGNIPIDKIHYMDIRKFVSALTSSAKRKNNI